MGTEDLIEDSAVSVRVALRVRPAIIGQNTNTIPRSCIHIVPEEPQIIIGKDEQTRKQFTYDYVYGPHTSQENVYSDLAAPLVSQFLEGFNATILAYGQTFSGKTYTMGSNNDETTASETLGIIPRVFSDIMNGLKEQDGIENVVKVSFLEIYQEQIRDLLNMQNSHKEISIRDSKDGTIVIAGIHEEIVTNATQMQQCLESGGLARATGDTQMHMHSSRSHAIFTITLEQISHMGNQSEYLLDGEEEQQMVLRRSKLHLVDLAGAERLKRTGAEGVRLKESVKINSGLLALGNVISILGSDRVNDGHVPYRDSKLTRLLQDSLGGNSQTLMIACVSPLFEDMDETINTLKYAYRARKIQNKPIVNIIDQIAHERASMQQKIDKLEGKLKGLEEHGASPVKFQPSMIDFDNEQWMQYFMDQLKNRTIRGANALKSLEIAKKENESLKQRISELEVFAADDGASRFEHSQEAQPLQILLPFSLKIIQGDRPNESEIEEVVELLKLRFPHEKFSDVGPFNTLVTLHQPAITTRAPSTNSIARSHRRRKFGSNDNLKEVLEDVNLKPLETELRESRKYLTQLEEELNRTKIMLKQNEAVSEESSREIQRLMAVNESLRENIHLLQNGHREDGQASEIMSIKVLTDASSQTHPVIDSDEKEDGDFEVHISHPESQTLTVQKLTDELNLATKAKVDLLKELSKLNKDNEKIRHMHSDQIQKLERELEANERELNKLKHEQKEKEHLKDRNKDDYERKIKLQEASIQKLKLKLKESEKNSKDRGSGALKENQQELEKLTVQLASLKKKVKEDHERFNEMEGRKSKEISVLSKQLEEESKKGRQNEFKLEGLRKKLDKKTEEIGLLSKRIKDQQFLNQPHKTSRKNSLDKLMDEDTDANSIMSTVDDSQEFDNGKKHELLIGAQEELNEVREQISEIENRIATVEDGSVDMQELKKQNSSLILRAAEIRKEITSLQHSSKDTSHGRHKKAIGILPIDFSKLINHIPDDEHLQSLINRLSVTTSEGEFIQIIEEIITEIISLKTNIQLLSEEPTEDLQAKLAEIEKLEKTIKKLSKSYDEKIQLLKEEHKETLEKMKSVTIKERKIHTAMTEVQTEPVEVSIDENAVKDLEKDVFYYRNANKELKSRLREVVAVNHRLAKTLKDKANSVTDGTSPAFPVAVE